ncbi:ZN569 protein, partial [Atrichornis clamosus]|nr:ZN569 protein [Atrichornis clamosus]
SDTLLPTGARGGFASEDDDGGHWDSGYGAPPSGWCDTEPGGCARTLPRKVPAGSGLFICGTRGLSLGAEAALRAHLDEPPHLGPPYLCGTCGKSFRHRRNLLTHKKLRGGARARHGCAECGRTFCLRGDLLRHRDTHRARPQCHRHFPDAGGPDEERPFVCGHCGRSFSWRESLQLHLRGHRAPE